MSSRPRPSSSLPKAPTTLDPSSIISDAAVLTGLYPITIGANAVLHPRARIVSTYGPVTIGPGCVVSERASVGLLNEPAEPSEDAAAVGPEGRSEAPRDAGVTLDRNVSIEPAAVIEARLVGEGSLLEAGTRAGAGAVIGKVCCFFATPSSQQRQLVDDGGL